MSLSNIETILFSKRDELKKRVQFINKDFRSGRDPDSGERAVEMENEAVLTELLREANEELLEIADALQRFNDGTYGVCANCKQPINEKRLKAIPYTIKCINCSH